MKLNRENLLARARNGEERALLAKSLDRVEIVLRSGLTQVTDFYDPYHTGLIISMVKSIPGLNAVQDGGFSGAERTRVAINVTATSPLTEDFHFAFISVRGNFKAAGATHRDFLGAMLGLGLKREKFGDILVVSDGCRFVAAAEVAAYILANLNKVGRVKVHPSEITAEEMCPPENDYKEIRATVPSMRLDAVAATGFGTSRSKISREITAERFSVNWRVCPDPSTPVREGDMLSARGRGRVAVVEVKGPLRSGRTGVLLKRFL